jgi:hypothetical protein
MPLITEKSLRIGMNDIHDDYENYIDLISNYMGALEINTVI